MRKAAFLIWLMFPVMLFCQSRQAIMDSVSVDPETGYIMMSWKPTNLDTTSFFIISRGKFWENVSPITSKDLDIIQAGDPLFYLDQDIDANVRYEGYRVCGSNQNYSDFHKTMFLTATADSCASAIFLEWSAYYGWDENILYRIYNYNTKELVSETYDTAYVYKDIEPNTGYTFFVRAFSEDNRTSSSNKVSYNTTDLGMIRYINPLNIKVNNESITISFEINGDSKFTKFYVYRSENSNMSDKQIIMTFTNYDEKIFNITDNTINSGTIYYYQLAVIDNCEKPVYISDSVFNILLSVEENDYISGLSWSEGNIWNNNAVRYEIYRLFNNDSISIPAVNSLEYSDSISILRGRNTNNRICYQVKTSYGGYSNTSNISCVEIEPEVFIPEMFTPDAVTNYEFKPEFDFIPEDYELIILDRYGREIFISRTYSEAWTAPGYSQGTYLYKLTYRKTNGKKKITTGYVNLIRNNE